MTSALTEEEVRAALRLLPNGRAPGDDGIPGEFLRACAIEVKDNRGHKVSSPMFEFVFSLMSQCWESGKIPHRWCDAVVVPVPKKGDLTKVDNYRGIALLSHAFKVFSYIVNNRLQTVAEKVGLFSRAQAGFRRGLGADMQIATLLEVLQRRQSVAGVDTHVCFVDFEKAYDKVPHSALLVKLERQGISGRLLGAIRAIYHDPTVSARDGVGGRTASVPYQCGVRQGDPLSPTLFNLYIDNIVHGLSGVAVPGVATPISSLLYADDLVIFSESREALASDVAVLRAWADLHEMSVNVAKCGYLVIPALVPETVPLPITCLSERS